MSIGTLLRLGKYREGQDRNPAAKIWGRRDPTPMVIGYENGPRPLGQLRELVEKATELGAPDDATIRVQFGLHGDWHTPNYAHVLWGERVGDVGDIEVGGKE